MSVRLRAISAARAACLAALLAVGCNCAPPPRTPVGPQIRVRELRTARPGAVGRVAGVAGDWTLEGGGLRVLIGGMQRPRRERGRVLALATAGVAPSDDFESLAPIVIEGDRSSELVVDRVEAAVMGDRAAVRVVGRAALPGGELRVERLHTIADVARTMAISTRVDRAVLVAERVAWGGPPPFVPFVGRVESSEWRDASWMGVEGPERAIVVGVREDARVRGELRPHGDHEYLRATELAVEVGPEEPVRTWVTTSREGLAGAVRRFGWARGSPFREATVAVTPLPPRAAVRVASTEGPWLRSRVPAGGRMQVPLPPGERPLTARATAYGHAASEASPIAPGARVRLRIPPSGRLRVAATDAATGARMPFRVRVVGTGASEVPDLGPVWSAAGARDVVASAGAPIELPLPLGEYRVIVTRGPEWSLEERPVVVTGARTAELAVALRRAFDPGAWVACDFHLHAAPSPDSHVTLEDRVTALVAEGVRYAVPTDHNHVTDYGPSVEALGVELGTIPGVEVTTWEPAFGHFNAFPFPLDPALPANGAPGFLGLTPAGLFAALRERSPRAIVQVNHPRLEPNIGYFDHTGLDPVTGTATGPYSDDYDSLEVWNGFDLARSANVERNLAEWIAMLARGRRVVATGSSDSHTIRTEWAGYPRTYVYVEGGIENARAALLEDAPASGDAGAPGGDEAVALDAGALDAGVPRAGGEDIARGSPAGGSIADGGNAGRSGADGSIAGDVITDGSIADGSIAGGSIAGGSIADGSITGRVGGDGAIAGDPAEAGPPPPPRVGDGDWRLVDALREGRAFVTNGPFIDLRVEGRGPGEAVSVGRRARVTLDVYAPAWIGVSSIDVYVGGRIDRTIPIRPRRARRGEPAGLRARERFDVRVGAPTFVLAVVRGEATMDVLFARRRVRPMAFTNPVWLSPR